MASISILVISYLLNSFCLQHAWSRPKFEDDNSIGYTIIDDSEVSGIIEDLEREITRLTLDEFVGDSRLFQSVDKLNDVTSYKLHGKGKNDPVVYERNSNDKGKKVIVLQPSEDKIHVRKAKRTFVGLRDMGSSDTYYVFYIYLRDAENDEPGAKSIGGQRKIVEFDSWENREDKLQKVSNGLGWSDCSSSIFIPCKTNESVGFAPRRKDHRAKVEKKSEKKKPTPKPEGDFETEDGYDVNVLIDFFSDMEDDIQKARAIGVGLDLLPGGMGGIPNLLTGVFGGVTQGVNGLLSGVVGTAGQVLQGGLSLGGGGAGGVLSGVLGGAGGVLSGVLGGVGGAVSGVVGAGSGILGAATNLISGTLGSILQLPGTLLGGLGGGGAAGGGLGLNLGVGLDLGGKLLGGLGGAISGVVGAVGNVAGGIVGGGGSGRSIGVGLNIGDTVGGLLSGVTGIVSGLLGAVTQLIGGVFQAGIGVLNTVLSFGGLGGPSAKPEGVGAAVGINLGGGRQMSLDYDLEVLQAIQRPQSGGMGGLLSLDIGLENEIELKGNAQPAGGGVLQIVQGRSVAGAAGASQADANSSAAEKEGRALLTLNLAEALAGLMGKKLGEELLKTGLIEHPGWKTMDEGGAKGDTLKHEDDAFVGFGGCIYKKVKSSDYDKAETDTEILQLLTTALRTQCASKEVKHYELLVSDGLLVLNSDKTFDLSKEHKYLQTEKLTPQRRSDLSRAFEMSLFSKAFKTELEGSPHDAPKHSKMSRRVHTFGEVILNGIQEANTNFRVHEIKILRSLLTTTKEAFTKLMQDHDTMIDCDECEAEEDINKSDQKHLMAIMEFILHGLGPVQKNPGSVRAAFKKFVETNKMVITNRVENYLL